MLQGVDVEVDRGAEHGEKVGDGGHPGHPGGPHLQAHGDQEAVTGHLVGPEELVDIGQPADAVAQDEHGDYDAGDARQAHLELRVQVGSTEVLPRLINLRLVV